MAAAILRDIGTKMPITFSYTPVGTLMDLATQAGRAEHQQDQAMMNVAYARVGLEATAQANRQANSDRAFALQSASADRAQAAFTLKDHLRAQAVQDNLSGVDDAEKAGNLTPQEAQYARIFAKTGDHVGFSKVMDLSLTRQMKAGDFQQNNAEFDRRQGVQAARNMQQQAFSQGLKTQARDDANTQNDTRIQELFTGMLNRGEIDEPTHQKALVLHAMHDYAGLSRLLVPTPTKVVPNLSQSNKLDVIKTRYNEHRKVLTASAVANHTGVLSLVNPAEVAAKDADINRQRNTLDRVQQEDIHTLDTTGQLPPARYPADEDTLRRVTDQAGGDPAKRDQMLAEKGMAF